MDVVQRGRTGRRVIGNSSYNIIPNGRWDSGRAWATSASNGAPAGRLTLTFGGSPVAAVGALINYAAGLGDLTSPSSCPGRKMAPRSVRTTSNTLMPISTPGGINVGSFSSASKARGRCVRLSGGQFGRGAGQSHLCTLGSRSRSRVDTLVSVGLLALAFAYGRGICRYSCAASTAV